MIILKKYSKKKWKNIENKPETDTTTVELEDNESVETKEVEDFGNNVELF